MDVKGVGNLYINTLPNTDATGRGQSHTLESHHIYSIDHLYFSYTMILSLMVCSVPVIVISVNCQCHLSFLYSSLALRMSSIAAVILTCCVLVSVGA